MNKEFVRKMIMAEQLKYEALKEILPERVRRKVDKAQREAFDLIKEIAFEMVGEKMASNSEAERKEETGNKKSSKKVDVDFM